MGKTSLEILMNDELYNDNDLNAKDPTVAWARIMATHVHSREGSGTQKRFCAVNTMIGEFANIRQTETNESITEYLRRYERAQKALLNAGFDVESSWLDSEEKKVVKFLYSLDQSKYGRMIRDVANLVVPIPASIRELIKVAKERKEVKTPSASQRTEVLVTNTATASERTAVMVTSKQESQRDPLNPHPRYSVEEWTAFTADERLAILKHNANIKNAAAALPQSAQRSRYNGSNKTQQDDAAQPRVRKQRRQAGAATLLTNHTDTDESDVDTNIVLATSLRDNIDSPPIIPFREEKTKQRGGTVNIKRGGTVNRKTDLKTDSCLAATMRDPFDKKFVLLDCASGTHLCATPHHATKVRPCRKGNITGIEGEQSQGTTYNESCEFVDPEFGRMPLAPGAVANILSLATARDNGFGITYNDTADEFTLTSPTEGANYTFGRMKTGPQEKSKSKFYAMSLATNKPPPKHGTTVLYTSPGEPTSEQTIQQSNLCGSIPTIQHNRNKYTKRQNRDAERAREFIASIGYPPLATAVQQVRSMRNCPIIEQDILRSYEIYGVPVQHIKGSTKKKNGSHAANDPGVSQVQADQSMELDLMFFGGNIFLVCILTPLEFSFCAPIKDKSAGTINESLKWIINESAARGFDVQWIKSDNEPAVTTSTIARMLAERRVATDQTAPGQHAARAERRIQFIKAKARALTCHLPYKVSRELFEYAVIAANRFTNMQTARSSQSPITPREKFLGRQSDFKRDVGMPFGSYCQCTQVNTDNTHGPRTEACIFLYPKESTTGSYYVLRLKNHRAVVRSNTILMPMPDAIIDRMDSQASEDRLELDETDERMPRENTEPSQQDNTAELHRPTRFMPTNAQTRQLTGHQQPSTMIDPIEKPAEISMSAAGLQGPEQEEVQPPEEE